MKTVTVYPAGLFEGDKPFDPCQQAPTPITLLIDGFPLDLEIKSLEGLNYWQKRQACRLHKDYYAQPGFMLFALEVEENLVLARVEEDVILKAIEKLTLSSFPLAQISLAIFTIAPHFKEPMLHVKVLPYGQVRLVYGDKKRPQLVRFVEEDQKDREVQETLTYLHQIFQEGPIAVATQPLVPSSDFWRTALNVYGKNKWWPWYWWPRVIGCLVGFLGACLGIAVMYMASSKDHLQATCRMQEATLQKLTQAFKGYAHQDDAQRYHDLLKIEQTLNQAKGLSYKSLVHALLPIPQDVRLHEIAWRPEKDLMLLASFSSWSQLMAYEEQLYHQWPGSKITRQHHPTSLNDMTVQWAIQF